MHAILSSPSSIMTPLTNVAVAFVFLIAGVALGLIGRLMLKGSREDKLRADRWDKAALRAADRE